MAKETTKKVSSCEEYVVNKLKETEQELLNVKSKFECLERQYNELEKIAKSIAKEIVLECEESDKFINIYFNGQYVGNVWKDNDKNIKEEKELIETIEKLKALGGNE